MELRRATPEDALALAACHVACWRESYAGIVPDEVLAGLDVDIRAAGIRRHLADPATPVLAVLHDGEIVGLSRAGPSRDDPPDPPVEVQSLYLRAAHHGSGMADVLLVAAVPPSSAASCWVFEANARARRFYARHDFAPQPGSRRIDPGTGVPEVRLVRPTPKRITPSRWV